MLQFGTAPIFANPIATPGSALATPSGPQRLGIMQDINIDITQKLVELFGQNKFPEDIGPSDMKISGKAAFAALEIDIYNDLMFADSITAGIDIIAPSEPHTLGGTLVGEITAAIIHTGAEGTGFNVNDTLAVTGGGGTGAVLRVASVTGGPPGPIATFAIVSGGSGYTTGTAVGLTVLTGTGAGSPSADITASVAGVGATVTVTKGATLIRDLGVQYAGAGYLTPVAVAPTLVTTYEPGATGVGTYTFAPADSHKVVLISYVYTSATGRTMEITQHLQGYGPIFETWLMEPYQGNNGLYLAACRVTKMGKPMKRAGYEISDFEFDAFAHPSLVGANGQPLVARFFQITP